MKKVGTPWLLAMAPLILAMVSVPLALGLVEPNAFYGVRIAATRASEAAWYRANHASGVAGAAGGLVGFALNLRVLRSSLPPLRQIQACLAVLVGLAALIAVTGIAAA